ncbi:uncharacterized protein LOC112681575 [Sipha flava]|uniref:Uncharacterized protein LOC112681575 n=1 Tax=Sipha flava TaxID=143950 RepID=A0A8B8FAG3_9HEMI|nr:uncharacterized protein LOC112681575 [Sipha flava]XP_025407606.1 uncharacterized protein LOC112681575 [Sipha flava]
MIIVYYYHYYYTLASCSIFNNGFLFQCYNKYVQPCRPETCKSTSHSFRNEGKIVGNTVYNCSYATYVCGSGQKPIKQNDNLVMAGEFDCLTINRMSYPIHCSSRVSKIVPRDHCLGGKTSMKKETTMVHDFYLPCDVDREKKILPRNNFRGYDDCPMDSLTTNNCSYQPVCTVPMISYMSKD